MNQLPQAIQFDLNDPKNIGRPYYWDIHTHIKAIVQMIRADEIQIALKMLKDVPGWYRDNYPSEFHAIRETLYRQMYDQFDYANDADEAGFTREFIENQCLSSYTFPRADILFDDIKKLNAQGEVPWLFEISPSHGWLPLGFAKRGLKFNFFGKNLNQPALSKIKEWLPFGMWSEKPNGGQVKILVCFEALEHMMNEHDLVQSAHKIGESFDFIYLSTPKYTLGGGLPDWDTRRLGHVRTWTPSEFLAFAHNGFPGYEWAYYDSHSMVIRGAKK